jgi:hypothetical protein
MNRIPKYFISAIITKALWANTQQEFPKKNPGTHKWL